jgi:hypothetical protein
MLGQRVDTTPVKHCPLLDRECLQGKCQLWVRFDRENGTAVETCTFVMTPLLHSQQIIETTRVEAAVESLRNKTVDQQDQLLVAVRQLGLLRAAGLRLIAEARRELPDTERDDRGGAHA